MENYNSAGINGMPGAWHGLADGLGSPQLEGQEVTSMAWPERESPYARRSIIRGMRVCDEDGKKLGHVALIGQEHLYVRRWPFSFRWSEVPLSRVRQVTRGAVVLEGREVGRLVEADKALHGEIPTQTHPLTDPGGWGGAH
jgi:hypothetical protein